MPITPQLIRRGNPMGSVACCCLCARQHKGRAVQEVASNQMQIAGSENSCMRMKAELLNTIVRVGGNLALPAKGAETLDAVACLLPFCRCAGYRRHDASGLREMTKVASDNTKCYFNVCYRGWPKLILWAWPHSSHSSLGTLKRQGWP